MPGNAKHRRAVEALNPELSCTDLEPFCWSMARSRAGSGLVCRQLWSSCAGDIHRSHAACHSGFLLGTSNVKMISTRSYLTSLFAQFPREFLGNKQFLIFRVTISTENVLPCQVDLWVICVGSFNLSLFATLKFLQGWGFYCPWIEAGKMDMVQREPLWSLAAGWAVAVHFLCFI